MHHDQITVTTAQATRLIDRAMPQWAGQRVRPLATNGTDNWMFRLGDDKVLRLPKRPSAVSLLRREWDWLPRLKDLPLRVPEPLALGEPENGFPYPWMVLTWQPGETLRPGAVTEDEQAALALARFVTVLRDLPGTSGPIAGSANHNRGVPLAVLDEVTRQSIAGIADLYPADDLLRLWDTALEAPPWSGAPLWLHGDLTPMNLLAVEGRLSAVIDFGLMARGDPATDLIPAWGLFDGAARDTFLDVAGLDGDTQARGRGWALYSGVIALAYYRDSNPALSRICRHTLDALLGRT